MSALFNAFAQRVEEGDFRQSCAMGTVTLDLDAALWAALIADHFNLGDATRIQSFAGLVLTTIEGAYIRCRAERSPRAFSEAGGWHAILADQQKLAAVRSSTG